MYSDLAEIIGKKVDALPSGLKRHTLRVEQLAGHLAHQHNTDQQRVKLGALAHDIARATKGEQLLRQARQLGIPIHPVEEQMPMLLHGPVAAESLCHLDGLDDPEVYEAIYWHSTAHKGLGTVAKVVFLADKLEPGKAGQYPFLSGLKDRAMASLDGAMLDFLTRTLVSRLQNGRLVHPASIEARNDLLLAVT